MISFALEEEETLLQDTVRRIAAERVRPQLRAIEEGLPAALRKTVAELGLGALGVPEADGGQGARLVTQLIADEELAWGDAGAALALVPEQSYLTILGQLATGDERARFLQPVASGAQLGAVAYCAAGPDSALRLDDDRLHGERSFVLGAANAHHLLVLTEEAAFVVAAGPGVTVTPAGLLLGLDAALPAKVTFDGAPAVRLADPAIAAKLPAALLAATLHHSARQVGLARAAYDFALDYTQERRAFGKPVAHFQSIAFTLADMAIAVDAARWTLWRGAEALGRPPSVAPGLPASLGLERTTDLALAAAAVVQCNEAAWHNADAAVQLLGGAGFCRDFPVEKWLRDAKALALCGVPSEWCREVIAAQQLGAPISPPSTWLQPFYL